MQKSLGFWRCWALVVGSMIGNGIFMLPAVLAPYGSYSLLGWLVAGTGTLFIVFTFALLARRSPDVGGPYAWIHEAFGEGWGFFVGWGHWLSYVIATAAGGVAAAGYLGHFFPAIGERPLLAGLLAVTVIWLLTAINLRGARSVGIVQLVTTLLKLLPLFVIAAGGFLLADVGAVPARNPQGESLPVMIASMVMITMWAYVGVENVTIPADDVIEPRRNIPLALIVGALTATAVYMLATAGVMALVPGDALAASSAPFADAATVLFGTAGAALVALGALVSIVGALNGNILATVWLGKAIADDGLLPQRMGGLSGRGVPAAGLVISSLFACLMIGMNYTRGLVAVFELLILLSTLTTLLPYAATAVASLVLQRRDGAASMVGQAVALGALAFALFAIAGSGLDIVAYGLVLLAAGIPLYLMRHRFGAAAGLSAGSPTSGR